LHRADEIKPFTCSALWASDGSLQHARVKPGGGYHLRLTALTPEVCRAWEQHFIRAESPLLMLDGCEFTVTGVSSTADEHGWAGRVTYGELLGRALARGEHLESSVVLQLASPLAFRTNKMTLPLPLPHLVFGSLAKKWNMYSPYKLAVDVRRAAEEGVGISSFHLTSAQFGYKQESLQIGAMGHVKFRHLNKQEEVRQALHILAEFALYAGIGIKTTMGMGQSRPRHE
jgi:CRISPR-associated endoribonuclease Cas6